MTAPLGKLIVKGPVELRILTETLDKIIWELGLAMLPELTVPSAVQVRVLEIWLVLFELEPQPEINKATEKNNAVKEER